MSSLFWDEKIFLLIDYSEKDKTIDSEYYCYLLYQFYAKTINTEYHYNLLYQLNDKLPEIIPGLAKKK